MQTLENRARPQALARLGVYPSGVFLLSCLTSHPRLGVSNPILDMKNNTHLHPLQSSGCSKCSIKAVTRRRRDGRRPQSLACLQKYPPWGPWKTPGGCARQHMAGGGAGRQVGAGRRRRKAALRKKEKPTQNRRIPADYFSRCRCTLMQEKRDGAPGWGKRNSSF